MTCTLLQGLPDQVKCLLCPSAWMDDVSIDQLLVHMQVIMKDEVIEKGMAGVAAQAT